MNKANDDIRSTFLAILKEPGGDLELLSAMLNETADKKPELFDVHQENALVDAIAADALDWNEGYYTRQRRSLEHNFSLERAQHLVEVCHWLHDQGHEGFTAHSAPQTSHGTSSMPNQNALTTFTPQHNLASAVQSGSVHQVRAALVVELENNRQDENSVMKAMAWAQAKIEGLFEPYDVHSLSAAIDTDKGAWDADYYHLQSVYLNSNFSRERFEHLIDVYRELHARAVKGFVRKPQPAPTTHTTMGPTRSRASAATLPASAGTRSSEVSPLRIAAIAGGAIAVLALLILALF
ncbi:hypothetical protein [Enterobacter sp.]|uniref:hypothetical protein n=1 Tax=Enterobacter sp. TaxID=42895 RepID=UPI00296E788B|nr:hypothetical protein [Enterobacter sp.]